MATDQENLKKKLEESPKLESVSDLYGKIFAEMWPAQKREETKDEKQMEGKDVTVKQVRSSKGRFDPESLLDIPADERKAIQRLTLIVHYYSDLEDALRTVTDASFVVQFDDLFKSEPKKVKRTHFEDGKEGEQEEVVISGPLRTLAPTLVVLKSFKPTSLLTLVQALPSIVHLQLVILSKSPFSGSQSEFMRDYLRFVGPNLVSLQMWIHAMHDRNAQDEVVSNLDRVWPVVDREMLKLQHLTLEVQQNSPKGRTQTPKLDNIMTHLQEFRIGSLDGSTNLDRMLDYLGQDETVPFMKGEYSQFIRGLFLTNILEDDLRRFVQIGLIFYFDLCQLDIESLKWFCSLMPSLIQLHFDLSKMQANENKVLLCIPACKTFRALRFRYAPEQHLRLWPRVTGPSQKSRISAKIVSLQLDVINVDCSTFEDGKFPDLFCVSQHLTKLRGLVIFFDDCISDYYELHGSVDGESKDDDKEARKEKEETEKDKKRAMFRKQAKVPTHREYYETYAFYLIEAGVLEHKLLQAVRIKFGARRTLEYTREQLLGESAKHKSPVKKH